MKAIVFAAGLGTRLKPFTETKPKALVPLDGVPMLERVILNIKSCGITDIIVNIHHFGQQIVNFLNENHNFGVNITISDETDLLLDTGGGILKAKSLLLNGDEPFVAHNSDIFTDINLSEMIDYHCSSSADATLLVKKRDTQRHLVFDNQNTLVGWTNIATGQVKPADFSITNEHSLMAFGGVHVISPSIFKHMEHYHNLPVFSTVPFYVDTCKEITVKGFNPSNHNWFDIGKMETLKQAEAFLNSK